MTTTNDNPDKTPEEEEDLEGAETEGEEEEKDTPSDSGEDSEDDDTESEEGSEDPLSKFKGKSPEELIEMYKNLEGMIDRKASERAQEILAKGGNVRPKAKPAEGEDQDLLELVENTDFTKMSPKEFAKWMLGQVDKRALAKAQDLYDQNNRVKEAVSREIRDASKEFPRLKDSAEYREMVIAVIESAAGRGETVSLKEACKKVDRALGGQAKPEEKKKPRTGVEKPTGTDSKPPESEDDQVIKGLRGTVSTGPLGGLGI